MTALDVLPCCVRAQTLLLVTSQVYPSGSHVTPRSLVTQLSHQAQSLPSCIYKGGDPWRV